MSSASSFFCLALFPLASAFSPSFPAAWVALCRAEGVSREREQRREEGEKHRGARSHANARERDGVEVDPTTAIAPSGVRFFSLSFLLLSSTPTGQNRREKTLALSLTPLSEISL